MINLHVVQTKFHNERIVNAILTVGKIIMGVDKDTKSLVHCDVGPQYESYIATLIHRVHIWVKVHSSNYTQGKRTK